MSIEPIEEYVPDWTKVFGPIDYSKYSLAEIVEKIHKLCYLAVKLYDAHKECNEYVHFDSSWLPEQYHASDDLCDESYVQAYYCTFFYTVLIIINNFVEKHEECDFIDPDCKVARRIKKWIGMKDHVYQWKNDKVIHKHLDSYKAYNAIRELQKRYEESPDIVESFEKLIDSILDIHAVLHDLDDCEHCPMDCDYQFFNYLIDNYIP